MNDKLRVLPAILGASIWWSNLAFVSSANSQQQTDSSALALVYNWGYMCATYSTLAELSDQLEDADTFKKIATANQDGVSVLKRLFAGRKKSINESYAFLIIDLNKRKAGYKLANELTGVIDELAWTPDQVNQVATLLNDFLNKGKLTREEGEKISDRKIDLAQAWIDYERLSQDPLVPKAAIAAFQGKLATRIKSSFTELNELAGTQPDAHKGISAFKDGYFGKTSVKTVKIFENPGDFATYAASVARSSRKKPLLDAIVQYGGIPISIQYEGDTPHLTSGNAFVTGGLKIDPGILVVDTNGKRLDFTDVKSGAEANVRFIGGGKTELATKVVVNSEGIH